MEAVDPGWRSRCLERAAGQPEAADLDAGSSSGSRWSALAVRLSVRKDIQLYLHGRQDTSTQMETRKMKGGYEEYK